PPLGARGTTPRAGQAALAPGAGAVAAGGGVAAGPPPPLSSPPGCHTCGESGVPAPPPHKPPGAGEDTQHPPPAPPRPRPPAPPRRAWASRASTSATERTLCASAKPGNPEPSGDTPASAANSCRG